MVPLVPQVPPASTSEPVIPNESEVTRTAPPHPLAAGEAAMAPGLASVDQVAPASELVSMVPSLSSAARSAAGGGERVGRIGHGRVDRPAGRPGGAAVRRRRERREHEILAGPHGDRQRFRPAGRGDEPAVVRHARRRDKLPRPRVPRPREHLPERGIGRHRHDRPVVGGRRDRGGHGDRPRRDASAPPTRTRTKPARTRTPRPPRWPRASRHAASHGTVRIMTCSSTGGRSRPGGWRTTRSSRACRGRDRR